MTTRAARLLLPAVFRPARLLALLAALQILGGHWVVVQSVAWVSMFMEYSQNGTWEEAVSKTFDGKHPCKLCTAAQRGNSEDKAPQSTVAAAKWEAVLGKLLLIPEPDFTVTTCSIPSLRAPARSEAPGVPPPRV